MGGTARGLKKENHVAGGDQLILLRSAIVGRIAVRPFKAYLRPQQDGGPNPMRPSQEVLAIGGLKSRALSANVVEIFVADGEVILLSKPGAPRN